MRRRTTIPLPCATPSRPQDRLLTRYCAKGNTTGCTSDSPFPFHLHPRRGQSNPQPNGTIEGARAQLRLASTYQLTASVQQELTKGTAISLAYVGALSRHLPMSVDENYPVFNTTTPTGQYNRHRPGAQAVLQRCDKGRSWRSTQLLGIVYGVNSNQTSNYNALQVTFSQQVTKGVSFNGFYTFQQEPRQRRCLTPAPHPLHLPKKTTPT